MNSEDVKIDIKGLTLGMVATNAYLIGDIETGEAVLIDPVDQADALVNAAKEEEWTITLVLATHGHFDHVLASKPLKDLTGAPFYIHKNGVEWLERLPEQGLRFGMERFPEGAKPDRLLTDETETIELGAIKLETIYTPGHAPDHIAYYLREYGILIGGDCLFAGSIGRTDLPGGDYPLLMRSITEKLLPLGDEVHLLPGHGQFSSLGRERQTNPFILEYLSK